MRDGWAAAQRHRWNASRIAAAIALHALLLAALTLAIDRVELPRRDADRTTTLLNVVLHAAPPPPLHALPAPARVSPPARTNARASRASEARPPAREPVFEPPQAIVPLAPSEPAVAAATPAASTPASDIDFRDTAATRQAIRAAGRGESLASRANALTHEDQGSELVAADGSHCNCKRNLPPPPAQALAQGIAMAHKADCMKEAAGLGLLAAPVLLAAEAMGKCAHKL